jgi:hypothetical protein
MNLTEKVLDKTVFTRNRERLMDHKGGRFFSYAVVKQARARNLMSDEHLTVGDILIEAWARMKSFRPKGESPFGAGWQKKDKKFWEKL